MELEHHADLAAQPAERRGTDIHTALEYHASDRHAAGLERVESGDGSENRRLARARRSHDGHQFAAADIERHAGEDLPIAPPQADVN